jgi:hypothetical protein
MRKKMILTAATVVLISGTVLSVSLTAFANDNAKGTKKQREYYDQNFLQQKKIFMAPPVTPAQVEPGREC